MLHKRAERLRSRIKRGIINSEIFGARPRYTVCIKYYKNPFTLFPHVFSHLPGAQFRPPGIYPPCLLGWIFVENTIVLVYAATVVVIAKSTIIIITTTTNEKT